MGEWSKISSKWLDSPDEHVTTVGPFRDRGERLLRQWLSRALRMEGGEVKLQIGVGFETDPETHEHRGAMLAIIFEGEKPIFMRPEEIKFVVAFLRSFYDESDHELTQGPFRDDLDGFVALLENSAKEAAMFEKGARRN